MKRTKRSFLLLIAGILIGSLVLSACSTLTGEPNTIEGTVISWDLEHLSTEKVYKNYESLFAVVVKTDEGQIVHFYEGYDDNFLFSSLVGKRVSVQYASWGGNRTAIDPSYIRDSEGYSKTVYPTYYKVIGLKLIWDK